MMKILKILCAFRGKTEDRRIFIELVKMERYVRDELRLFGISNKLSDVFLYNQAPIWPEGSIG